MCYINILSAYGLNIKPMLSLSDTQISFVQEIYEMNETVTNLAEEVKFCVIAELNAQRSRVNQEQFSTLTFM